MKKWMIISAVIALSLIGGAAYLGFQSATAQQVTTSDQAPPTVTLSRGDVQQTVIAPGKVVNTGTAVVASALNSNIIEIAVQPGDSVKEGDTLAWLDETSAQRAITEAELAVAQAALNTDPNTVARTIAQAQIDVAQTELHLASAQNRLDKLINWEPAPDTIALAEAELAAAQGRYQAALAIDSSGSYRVASAQVRLGQAQRALNEAQAKYDNAWDEARDWEQYSDEASCLLGQGGPVPCTGPPLKDGLEGDRQWTTRALDAAEDNLAIAELDYNAALAGVSYGSSTAAESEITRADQALAEAKSGPTSAEIEVTRAEAQQRQLDLERAQLQLEAAQNNTQAELSLAQAQLNLEKAEADLAATIITAPMDGVVLAVMANVGDAVSSGMGLIRLANPQAQEIQVTVIEEDLPLVQVGQPVDVFFDAQPDAEVQGTVARIVPQRVQGSDRPLYSVYISIPDLPEGIVADMTVDTSIILDQRADVLRLPRSLVSARSGGTAVVKVWNRNAIEERTVEVGLRGDTYIEILGGIAEGEEIVGQ